MSSIKVVDVNNEEDKQEEPTEPIEEAKEEIIEQPIEEVKQETNEATEESKEVLQVEKKVSPQNKLVRCPKCNREMKLKSYRYGHEQKCQGTLEQKPVKPFSKPRATPKQLSQSESSLGQSPKPKVQPIIKDVDASASDETGQSPIYAFQAETSRGYRDVEEQPITKPKLSTPVSNQVLKPTNPLIDITNHYQLLQQQYIQQKKKSITIFVRVCFQVNLKNDNIII